MRRSAGRWSRGGFGAKAGVIADGRGRALGFALAPGHATPRAAEGAEAARSAGRRAAVARRRPRRQPPCLPPARPGHRIGAEPAIPCRATEAQVRCPDGIDANRHRVEPLWARLEEWRAVATR